LSLEVYEIVNGLEGIKEEAALLQRATRIGSGHNYTFFKKRVKLLS